LNRRLDEVALIAIESDAAGIHGARHTEPDAVHRVRQVEDTEVAQEVVAGACRHEAKGRALAAAQHALGRLAHGAVPSQHQDSSVPGARQRLCQVDGVVRSLGGHRLDIESRPLQQPPGLG
jgi:hypothetical protein